MSSSKPGAEEVLVPAAHVRVDFRNRVYAGEQGSDVNESSRHSSRKSLSKRHSMTFAALVIVVLLAFTYRCHGRSSSGWLAGTQGITSAKIGFLPDKLDMSWAMYSPYFPVEDYQPPPKNCRITQINILQRHGARFPTSGASKNIVSAVTKLKSATTFTNPKLKFLTNFTYDLGTDNLVPFGAFQSFQAGMSTVMRYQKFVNSENLPFVRASSSQRVVDSATNWTAGWQFASEILPPLAVILQEDRNDTLDDAMCPNAGGSDTQTEAWVNTFAPPIAARLNAQAPGANLSPDDIYNLLSLCPFDTVAKEQLSPFCGLFSVAEFQKFEYFGDLDKYYNTGYGQALGRVQGVGYVNELLARLTGTPVQDNTQTNRTLDDSPITFPLNRTFYADFSHDNQMIAIYAAIGLFPQATAPDPTSPDPNRNWLASYLVPFSARMVTEKLECAAGAGVGTAKGKGKQEYVRILVNDALQPLEFCGAGQYGLCELQAFVNSQSYSRNDGEGDFEKCFS